MEETYGSEYRSAVTQAPTEVSFDGADSPSAGRGRDGFGMGFTPTSAIVSTERGCVLAERGGPVGLVGRGVEGGKTGKGADAVTGGFEDELRHGAA